MTPDLDAQYKDGTLCFLVQKGSGTVDLKLLDKAGKVATSSVKEFEQVSTDGNKQS